LPCLEYAHMHGCPQEEWSWIRTYVANSLPVLRYVCEHMDPAFAARTLKDTVNKLNLQIHSLSRRASELSGGQELDWPLVLYVGRRKLGAGLPKDLTEAIAGQKERAAALAGVFWKAGRQLRAEETKLLHRETARGQVNSRVMHADAERIAMWDAMGRVPKELQERIAVEAHLIFL
jgi:hypothetical protein